MRRLAMVVSVLMMGCSGSMSGTVGGVSMSVSDAIFALRKDGTGRSQGAMIILSDKGKLCDNIKANRISKGATYLSLGLYRATDTEVLAPDVGDYSVADDLVDKAGFQAFASFSRTDANCTNTISQSASTSRSGLVKVSNFKGETNGMANGTFDITFGAGDKVTGSFNASFCDFSSVSNLNCE